MLELNFVVIDLVLGERNTLNSDHQELSALDI
jgi:hypothetical protein